MWARVSELVRDVDESRCVMRSLNKAVDNTHMVIQPIEIGKLQRGYLRPKALKDLHVELHYHGPIVLAICEALL